MYKWAVLEYYAGVTVYNTKRFEIDKLSTQSLHVITQSNFKLSDFELLKVF